MRVVFFGTPDFINPIKEMLRLNFELVKIVSGQEPNQTLADDLKQLQPDLIVVAAYGYIIPQSILDIPKYGALNVHPSLLPKYRGASPIQSALLNGDSVSGITIIKMDEQMDHGPIIFQEEVRFSQQDNCQILSIKMFQRASEILKDLIPQFVEGKVELKEQDHSKATFCNQLKKEDGYFEIDSPPPLEQLDRMIRAYYSWPTAWTKWKDKIVKFLPDQMVQMEGKKAVKLKDFLNGYPDFPIKLLT